VIREMSRERRRSRGTVYMIPPPRDHLSRGLPRGRVKSPVFTGGASSVRGRYTDFASLDIGEKRDRLITVVISAKLIPGPGERLLRHPRYQPVMNQKNGRSCKRTVSMIRQIGI
jgi:hypothetical protein